MLNDDYDGDMKIAKMKGKKLSLEKGASLS
jgi:hypothetical protein